MKLIDKILDKFALIILYLLGVLILTGGFQAVGPGYKIEISQLNIFGIFLLIIFVVRFAINKTFLTGSSGDLIQKIYSILTKPATANRNFLIGIIGVFGVLFFAHTIKHWTFGTRTFDMSMLHQPLMNATLNPLMICDMCRNGTQFAEHILWSLYVFAPLTWLLKSDIFIYAIKTAVLAVPFYLFAVRGPLKDHKSHWFLFLFIVALSMPFRNSQVWDFREDDFAFGLFLLFMLSLYKGSLVGCLISFVLLLGTKENVPVVTAFLIVPIIWAKESPFTKSQRQKLAIFVGVTSVLYLLLVVKVIIPHFMTGIEAKNNIIERFPGMGNTMSEFAQNVLRHPFDFLIKFGGQVFKLGSLRYLVFLLLPFTLIRFGGWAWAAPAVPGILMNVLAVRFEQKMMVFHYEMIILPFLFAGVAFGIKNLIESSKDTKAIKAEESIRTQLVLAVMFGLCVAGRPPLFELTDRLLKYGDRITASFQMDTWTFDREFASTDYMLTHFHRYVGHLPLQLPYEVTPLSEDRLENLRKVIEFNPIRPSWFQGRDPINARLWVIPLEHKWGPFFEQELLKLGAKTLETAYKSGGERFAVKLETESFPFDKWCEIEKICRVPFEEK